MGNIEAELNDQVDPIADGHDLSLPDFLYRQEMSSLSCAEHLLPQLGEEASWMVRESFFSAVTDDINRRHVHQGPACEPR